MRHFSCSRFLRRLGRHDAALDTGLGAVDTWFVLVAADLALLTEDARGSARELDGHVPVLLGWRLIGDRALGYDLVSGWEWLGTGVPYGGTVRLFPRNDYLYVLAVFPESASPIFSGAPAGGYRDRDGTYPAGRWVDCMARTQ